MTNKDHWNALYESREEAALTWFEEEATLSRALIADHARPGGPIVDIGGGASRLVDGLLEDGFGPLTVLDLSEAALSMSRNRLGKRADEVCWLVADVTRWSPSDSFTIWHDRAVLHFLTDPSDRAAYVATMARAVEPGGHAILATFDLAGPEKCAGLPVQRYSPQTLSDLLEENSPGQFASVTSLRHGHRTPLGKTQEFQVSVFRRL